MELFREICEIFELKTLNFQKQTKKTLLNWAKRVKFEERRTKFFESCGDGKILSKVSICKQKDRPEWTKPLEGQKVKDIRKAIREFLKALGLLKQDPKQKKKIEKLAKERNWEAVITLSKDSFEDSHKKEGSGGHGSGRYARPNRVGRDGRRETNPRFRHIARQARLSRQLSGEVGYQHPQRNRRMCGLNMNAMEGKRRESAGADR